MGRVWFQLVYRGASGRRCIETVLLFRCKVEPGVCHVEVSTCLIFFPQRRIEFVPLRDDPGRGGRWSRDYILARVASKRLLCLFRKHGTAGLAVQAIFGYDVPCRLSTIMSHLRDMRPAHSTAGGKSAANLTTSNHRNEPQRLTPISRIRPR